MAWLSFYNECAATSRRAAEEEGARRLHEQIGCSDCPHPEYKFFVAMCDEEYELLDQDMRLIEHGTTPRPFEASRGFFTLDEARRFASGQPKGED